MAARSSSSFTLTTFDSLRKAIELKDGFENGIFGCERAAWLGGGNYA